MTLGEGKWGGNVMRKLAGLSAFPVILMSGAAMAEVYTPLAPVTESLLTPGGVPLSRAAEASAESASVESAAVAAPPLKCATPPAASALGTAQFLQTTTDFEGAVAAGLPVGSMSATTAKKVLIQDWLRTANCLSTDGQTELVYGQGIRLFASSDGFDAEGDVTLGMLAANSTLNSKNSKVLVSIIGFNDSQLTAFGSSIFGPINVDRFSAVDGLAKKMIDRAAALNNGTVQRLGVVFPPSSSAQHVMSAFAVQQIANGLSCNDTKSKFADLSPPNAALIASVYEELEARCDNSAPDPVARARAKVSLGNVKIRM